MFNMHQGQQYDRFLYAAMLSRARIEQAWSGGSEDVEAPNAAPKEEPQAFDPDMLKKLAEKAESGDIPEQVAPPANRSSSGPDLSCFSPAVIQAAMPLMKASAFKVASSVVDDDENSSVPLAFRPKKPKGSGAVGVGSSIVPLAFLKKKQDPASDVQTNGANSREPHSNDSSNLPALTNGDEESLKRDFQEKLQQTQKMFQEAQAQIEGGTADNNKTTPREGSSLENDARNTEAVSSIVSSALERAQAAAEATRTFHSLAPELKSSENKEARKKSKWDEENRPLRVDTSDPAFANRSRGDASAPGDKISESYMVPSLRELSALARGEPNPDAPALGELRAPKDDSRWQDPNANKTGAQVARDQRSRALGHHKSRSRSRRRPRRRSPSTSPERAGKRLFTDKPTFRMTGSSFSAASSKKEPGKEDAKKISELKKDDLPDWLKDITEPSPAPAMIQLGKKYLHMPRIMVEVLTHNGGEAIRTCMEKSGAQIRVETTIEEPIGIISVNGPVVLGEQCIREVLANKGLDLPPQDGLVLPYKPHDPNKEAGNNMQDIQIPSELVRHFVGHRGCNLKAITQKLGHSVSIQILPSILPGGFQRIQISGSNRKEARSLVIQHIDDLKRQKLTLWGDTHNQQRHQHTHTPVHAPVHHAPPPPPPPIPAIHSGVSI